MSNKPRPEIAIIERQSRAPWIVMLVFGFVALIAAFVLTLDKFKLLENPNAVLSCSINLVLNCSRVMQTWQSSVFGFPNMIIGLMAYASIVTVAVGGLLGTRYPRAFLIAGNIGYALGAIFAYWLFFQSVFAIEILCPWCLIVTFSTTLILASMTHYNLKNKTFTQSGVWADRIEQFTAKGYDKLVVFVWLAALAICVFAKFGTALFM